MLLNDKPEYIEMKESASCYLGSVLLTIFIFLLQDQSLLAEIPLLKSTMVFYNFIPKTKRISETMFKYKQRFTFCRTQTGGSTIAFKHTYGCYYYQGLRVKGKEARGLPIFARDAHETKTSSLTQRLK